MIYFLTFVAKQGDMDMSAVTTTVTRRQLMRRGIKLGIGSLLLHHPMLHAANSAGRAVEGSTQTRANTSNDTDSRQHSVQEQNIQQQNTQDTTMNTIYIIHGYKATVQDHWFQSVAEALADEQTQVVLLSMPNSAYPNAQAWLETLSQKVSDLNSHSYFIAHSLGTITLLNYLTRSYLAKQPVKEQHCAICYWWCGAGVWL